MIDLRPRHQFGYILPVQVGDLIHYQFYRILPPDCLMVGYPLNLTQFSAAGVDSALEQVGQAFDFLIARNVERISLGGIPLSAFAGRPRILSLLEDVKQRTGIPCTTDFEEVIEAIQSFGLRRVAVAAKWAPPLLQAVVDYLAHAGIATAGVHGHAHSAQQVVALRPQESVDIALALGREAFAKMPDADGLLLAGGAWLVMQAVPMLEAEFDKPVISNPAATYWAMLKQARLRATQPGFGRLIDRLRI